MYLLALLFPPLAILLCGRIFQAAFSLLLLPFYFPSALWAILVVADHKANKRTDRLIKAQGKAAKATVTTQVQVINQVTVINQPPPAEVGNPLVDEVIRDRQRKAAERARTEAERVRLNLQLENERAKARRDRIIRMIASSPKQALNAIGSAGKASIVAYHELPEWAQPISWGLAAGTPFGVIAAFLFLTKR